jgi:integrase
MKLTKQTVAALTLPESKADEIFWDDELPGFGVRLRGKSKSYIAQFRVGRQQRRKSVGDARKLDLEVARKVARQHFAQAALGIDVVAERRAKGQAAAVPTVGKVADLYCDAKQAIWRPATRAVKVLYFLQHWAPLREFPIDAPPTILRQRVAAGLREIAKDSGRVTARQARVHLAAMFAWAMREGLCEANPVAATNDPGHGIRPRERVLSDAELAAVWHAADGADDFSHIVRLLMLTGCRRGEVGGLRWGDVNLDSGAMTIPGERTKTNRTLGLGLPAVAVEILRSVRRKDGCLFGRSERGFNAWHSGMRALNRRLAVVGTPVTGWSLHDVRRSVRSGLGRLGIAPHIAERVIGHAPRGVESVYDRFSYAPQIRAALQAWADHLLSIVEGRMVSENVVPMKSA